MPARRTVGGVALLRPLLGISREQTRDACAAGGLKPWDDPHNADDSYARVRIRHSALPALVAALGPGVVENLARTAELLGADAEALDALARAAATAAVEPDGSLRVAPLIDLPAAVRTRVLHGWARGAGAPGGALFHRHVTALDALVNAWRGQGAVDLPGGVAVLRRGGRLVAVRSDQSLARADLP
jgi:tRNA(Ile)-lysidine synthase